MPGPSVIEMLWVVDPVGQARLVLDKNVDEMMSEALDMKYDTSDLRYMINEYRLAAGCLHLAYERIMSACEKYTRSPFSEAFDMGEHDREIHRCQERTRLAVMRLRYYFSPALNLRIATQYQIENAYYHISKADISKADGLGALPNRTRGARGSGTNKTQKQLFLPDSGYMSGYVPKRK